MRPHGERRGARADPWPAFDHAVRSRHGVGDAALAVAHGVSTRRFRDRAIREGWEPALHGVRLHPAVPPSVQQALTVVAVGTSALAAASRDTAAWLHGLVTRPPARPTVVVHHRTSPRPFRDVVVHRARWLSEDDLTEVDGVPTLAIPAMLLSGCGDAPAAQRARLVDVLHRRLATPAEIVERLDRAGPVRGRRVLADLCDELGPLLVESIFQDEVARTLQALGYEVERSTRRIGTADGIGLTVDVALPRWRIALEPEGDRFHRSREQRRADRRRIAAYAGTDWTPVPIDWRDWHLDRPHVLAAIDAAIAAQQRRGTADRGGPPARRLS